jgi:hypothetical protein
LNENVLGLAAAAAAYVGVMAVRRA